MQPGSWTYRPARGAELIGPQADRLSVRRRRPVMAPRGRWYWARRPRWLGTPGSGWPATSPDRRRDARDLARRCNPLTLLVRHSQAAKPAGKPTNTALSSTYGRYAPMPTTGWLSLMDPPGRVLGCGAAGSRPAARLDGAVIPRCRGRAGLACPLAGRPEASSERVLAASRSSERPGSFPRGHLTGQAGRCRARWWYRRARAW